MHRNARTLLPGQDVLGLVDQAVKKEFDSNHRILNFDEYLVLLSENPERQMRGSAQYLVHMMDYFGTSTVPTHETSIQSASTSRRFRIFDEPIDGIAPKVVGQEAVQNQIYKTLQSFARQGLNNQLILLHGPNGSAKSSMIHALMGGLEKFSKLPEGAVYSINWIFPIERYTKGGIGINTHPSSESVLTHYAKLPDEEIAARIPCELKDHPLLVIPQEQRLTFLESLLGKEIAAGIWKTLPTYLTKGDLCHRCKQIFDALLIANSGDFKKLLMHIQVERIYLARRYRKSLVTIEPQMHVDAQYHQLTYNKSMGVMPASIQGINLFALTGDLIDGNRGIIEFSDLLKRPVDSFKYLLSACETGAVNVGNSIAYLDSIFLGSTNEVQLDAFKEFPDFTSFKARIELIRVPYLLSASQEAEIYSSQLNQIAGDKHVAPHVAWSIALWSVLTRLKKPNSINYSPHVSSLISNLSPLEKSRLYDTGEVPAHLPPEDRKLLKASLRKLREEYSNIPYYEGRMGASAREVKTVLFDAAQNQEYTCLSPLSVLRELEEFIKRVSEYDFLKQEVKDGFHDSAEFISIVRNEYLNKIDREVRDSIGLYDSAQWEEFLKKYVHQISLVLKKEKIKNSITGRLEDPDLNLIHEFEKIVEAPSDTSDQEAFRKNIISQVGVWSLDHPHHPVIYAQVFPDFWKKLEKHYFESQKSLLAKMSDALLVYHTDQVDPSSEGATLARQTVNNMKLHLGYCEDCAKEVITFLMRQRY
jgi:predicted Ser/Thr protein kinase